MVVGILENTVETLQDTAVMLFKSHFLAVGIGYISVKFHYVEQWLVILVNQDHSLTSRLLVGSTEDITEAYGVIVNNRCYIILFFCRNHKILNVLLQSTFLCIVGCGKRENERRMFRPFLFKGINFQSTEQFPLTEEVVLQR